MENKEVYMNASIIGNGAVDAENLRPTADNNGRTLLRPAGMPGTTDLPEGWKPVAAVGDMLIVTKGRSVGIVPLNGNNAVAISPAALPGEARCALAGDEKAVVMTDAGAVTVGSDGSVSSENGDYPAISLLAVADADISAPVGDRKLSRAYTGGLFEKKDRDALVGDLADAYRHMCVEAAASGVMLQPALARYKLVDSGGRILFESAPVLLTHADGAQCTDTVALTSADRQTVDGYTVVAKSWHLEALLPSADMDVAQAEIFMTPLFHPFDAAGEGSAMLMRAGEAGAPFCRIGLPGRENGLGSSYRDKSRRTIMQAIARIEQLEERVAVIRDPFGGSARKMRLDIAVDADPMAATARIKRALGKSVVPRVRGSVILGAPHGFSAACVAEASGAVAWGNICALPYAGYPVGMFAAGVTDSAWTCHSAVFFEGDAGVERQESGDTNAPSVLGPVICYPLPEARSMTMICYHDGRNHSVSFDFTAEASGRYAVYVSPDLRPFSPAVCAPTVAVTVTEHRVDLPGCVALASSSRPLCMQSVIDAGSEVVAILGRNTGNQAWDFGRSYFTLACRGAIFSMGINLNNGRPGLRTVSDHGIDRGDAIATGVGGDIFIAAGGIRRISRTGRSEIYADDNAYVATAYDSPRGELWALREDGAIDIYVKGRVYFRYTRITAEALKYFGRVFAVAGNKVYDSATVVSTGQHHVRLHLRCNIRPNYLMRGVARLHTAMQASAFAGTVTVNGSGISDMRPWLIRRAGISGAVAGPLTITLPCRPARAADVVIEGDVSEDFVFANACLKLK